MAKDESVRGREIRTTWEDSGKSTKSSSSRKKSSSRRSLDDYLMKKNKRSGAHNRQIEECDISLCTATTSAKPLSQPTCVMKRNPQAIVHRMPSLNRFSSLAKVGSFPNLMLIEVKDATSKPVTEVATSHFGGVSLGIANYIYGSRPTPELKIKPRPTTEETRNDNEGCDQRTADTDRTVESGYSYAEECSVEVSMPSINEGFELELGSFTYEEGYAIPNPSCPKILREQARLAEEKCTEEVARYEKQKILARELQMADEVKLAEIAEETKKVYVQKDKHLTKLAEEAVLHEAINNTKDSVPSNQIQKFLEKLEEEKRIAKNNRLEEEKCLDEEEQRILERRRILKETYRAQDERLQNETRRIELRLLEQAKQAEERHEAEQVRLEEASRQVEKAKHSAEEARRLVDQARILDSLTFDTDLVLREDLHTLSEEQSFDLSKSSSESSIEIENCLSECHWKEMDASTFNVRGTNYIKNGKKVASSPNLLRLIAVDFVEVSEPIMTGFCSHPNGRVQGMLHCERQQIPLSSKMDKMPPFVFCMNMVLPGPPHYHLVMYYAVDNLEELGLSDGPKSKSKPFSKILKQFLFGSSDGHRNQVLKIIPLVKEGSFLLKRAIGSKPLILGKYLDQKFVQGERFLEAIVDVSSSVTTQKLLKLSAAYKTKVAVGMAFVLEAKEEADLPEAVLGSVELNNDNFEGDVRFFDHE
uniref:Protein ENHANCED DISEASE RESISTANCE 2 C-terminal domain-containing protein n=1 Tax=Chaetoceros debilis TaxID=122233 RepID=A0A6S8UH01_9STRA